ncbi:MAG: phosphate starvation-inducible protein PhoH [Rhodanobacter sp. 68-29]|uniref:PhoH family protein n=1 Tax=Rhodanobacter sp. PCA2 TaxID=2006117 RepID=UPI00086C7E66|nr:PhoH family protein [Rhodanobacter sp. PCA2]MBA2078881.1 phosphate starvation-inducible protein PhoH [Rhodanobacter sp. PCA2]MBN8922451.1 PhoH family protein [Rhodanobacter sp.]ODU74158.1 MAG: phosphate starvation-inducible protein PhoH [Rhodanobacter sp. SCN 69-32]OJY60601.1 MAG: phosphate starvation-inducible protein PhoH [Rhodanobacter sp. 68-29]
MTESKRIYALDTNVLLHDPTSLFRFEEHDVFIPMTVLEELDEKKKGASEVSRNGRQVSRFLNELIVRGNGHGISNGLELANPQGVNLKRGTAVGRLYFQQRTTNGHGKADNLILSAVIELRDQNPGRAVILVTKDINLRIKAKIYGIDAEDYENDRALDDFALLYTGSAALPENFWDRHPEVESWNERGRTYYKLDCREDEDWYPNECLYLPGEGGVELRVLHVDESKATLALMDDHSHNNHSVWGIAARNREQNFALNALMDPDVDFVTLLGTAGTGKTLLALAAGLAQVMDQQRYREIIMTRATVSVGEDIGFLPGTEEEKMTPWMGALTDNLEVLANPEEGGSWGRQATNDLLASRIKIRSLNFMRGRTFLSRYLIIDEAQNLTPKQMKTLITRAGPGTKIVCLGNVEQIDTPYLTETTSGLTYAVDRFKNWDHSAHVTLRRGERSRLADFASEAL